MTEFSNSAINAALNAWFGSTKWYMFANMGVVEKMRAAVRAATDWPAQVAPQGHARSRPFALSDLPTEFLAQLEREMIAREDDATAELVAALRAARQVIVVAVEANVDLPGFDLSTVVVSQIDAALAKAKTAIG